MLAVTDAGAATSSASAAAPWIALAAAVAFALWLRRRARRAERACRELSDTNRTLHEQATARTEKLAESRRAALNIAQDAQQARALAERHMQESDRAERRYRQVIEAAPSAIVAVDREGRIVLVNRLTERLFGYERHELLGRPIEMLVPERLREQHPQMRAAFFAEPQTRAMGAGRDLFGRHRDGTEFPVEIGLNPLETPEGLLVLGAIVDITARKHAEDTLRRTAQQLAESNQELEQFAYMASHDLQEPLRKLISFASLLVDDLGQDLPEAAATDIHYITDSAARMQTLVKDLLHLSRAGRAEMKRVPVSLDACVDSALATLAGKIEETGAEITRDALPVVLGDMTLLTALYVNLVGNAIKFARADHPPAVHLGAQHTGGAWMLSVRDNGIGIDTRYRDVIFEPFRRLHGRDEYEGSGVGLAICKKAVERHGGRISVTSTPGEGSCFIFTLPAHQTRAVATAPADALR